MTWSEPLYKWNEKHFLHETFKREIIKDWSTTTLTLTAENNFVTYFAWKFLHITDYCCNANCELKMYPKKKRALGKR